MDNKRIIPLLKFLNHKAAKDNCEYDYAVTSEGNMLLRLNVYRINSVIDRGLLFSGVMIPDKTMRSSDNFQVIGPNATYSLEFFM